ncbi:MAG: glycosyltransferase [Nanoarchaeota archaeon]|nr:glycosyltransferase [Nanoarchaeota archaeon]
MENKKVVLPDVSLCAIVRDEKVNPAGGIKRFVESHVPYVEEAVIVDTGSIDGTREVLEELELKCKNLKVYDRKFIGFADARNFSLSKANTKYALVLDADELLTHKTPFNDWKIIKNVLEKKGEVYHFSFNHILPSGQLIEPGEWKERLFKIEGTQFSGICGERHYRRGLESGVSIKHFLQSKIPKVLKWENFYNKLEDEIIKKNISPSQVDGFNEWKEYNPRRDLYE